MLAWLRVSYCVMHIKVPSPHGLMRHWGGLRHRLRDSKDQGLPGLHLQNATERKTHSDYKERQNNHKGITNDYKEAQSDCKEMKYEHKEQEITEKEKNDHREITVPTKIHKITKKR